MQANQIPPLPGRYIWDEVTWSIFLTCMATFVYWAKGKRKLVIERKKKEADTERGERRGTAAH